MAEKEQQIYQISRGVWGSGSMTSRRLLLHCIVNKNGTREAYKNGGVRRSLETLSNLRTAADGEQRIMNQRLLLGCFSATRRSRLLVVFERHEERKGLLTITPTNNSISMDKKSGRRRHIVLNGIDRIQINYLGCLSVNGEWTNCGGWTVCDCK
jgi:hypothetical protein